MNALDIHEYFRFSAPDLSEAHRAGFRAKAQSLIDWFKDMPEIDVARDLEPLKKQYTVMYGGLVKRFSEGEITVDEFVMGGDYIEGLSRQMGEVIGNATAGCPQ
jgi:hypothetical protein